jgi:hypothetical protein
MQHENRLCELCFEIYVIFFLLGIPTRYVSVGKCNNIDCSKCMKIPTLQEGAVCFFSIMAKTAIVARMWRLIYIRRCIGLTTGFIGLHTVTHSYSVYALQLTTVHYNTCRVFTLYLHSFPVFQYRRILSPATLQLFSEDCCSARILTRNC